MRLRAGSLGVSGVVLGAGEEREGFSIAALGDGGKRGILNCCQAIGVGGQGVHDHVGGLLF